MVVSSLPAEEAALSEYASVCRTAKAQLRSVWADLELSEEAVKDQTERIMARAHAVWSEAVAQAKQEQAELLLHIEEAGKEARSLQQELGQSDRRASLGAAIGPEDMNASALTTHARYQRAKREVEYWRVRKHERIEQLQQLRGEVAKLQELLGQSDDDLRVACVEISDNALEDMRAALEDMRRDQTERASRLAETIQDLQEACKKVDVDHHPYVAAAHISLENFRYSAADNGQFKAVADSLDGVVLSDSTFRSMEKQMDAVLKIQAERERQVQASVKQLQGVWEFLQMGPGDVDRALILKLLESDERLHTSALEKCRKECERLEVKKARKTCHTIRLKYDEFSKLAAETHLLDQEIGALVQGLHGGPGPEGPIAYVHKVAETLARVQQNIEEVKEAAVKRQGVLDKIDSIQAAVSEVEWLKEYEQDSNRFKGRDSTRNLQRSIKAERVRAQLPSLLEGTIQALSDWEEVEGDEFVYDGTRYMAHLVALKEESEKILRTKSTRGSSKNVAQSKKAGSVPVTPARGQTPSRTPLPKHRQTHGAPSSRPSSGSAAMKRSTGGADVVSTLRQSSGRAVGAAGGTATRQKATISRTTPMSAAKGSPTSHGNKRSGQENHDATTPTAKHGLPARLITNLKGLQELDINSPTAESPSSRGSLKTPPQLQQHEDGANYQLCREGTGVCKPGIEHKQPAGAPAVEAKGPPVGQQRSLLKQPSSRCNPRG